MTRYLMTAVALAALAAPATASPPPPQTLEKATAVLDELAAIPLKGVPARLLAEAQGVVIVPHAIKVGFLVGTRGGHGVVLVRDQQGNWSDPKFVHFGGASVGFQAGIESSDVVLVFRTRKSLDRVLSGKEKVTLGADVSVAAGPVGREALAATDPRLRAEVYSYSRTRGLFAGVALDGSAIFPDEAANAAYRTADAEQTKAAEQLKRRLIELGTSAAEPVPYVVPAVRPARPRLFPRRPARWNR